jgi:hypothetical protein
MKMIKLRDKAPNKNNVELTIEIDGYYLLQMDDTTKFLTRIHPLWNCETHPEVRGFYFNTANRKNVVVSNGTYNLNTPTFIGIKLSPDKHYVFQMAAIARIKKQHHLLMREKLLKPL